MRKERKIINTNIRLNLCDEQDRQAWEYLQTMDRQKYKSYTKAVVAALNDYFAREYRNEEDPYLESREKEDAFLERVETAIRDGVKESVPMAMAKNLFEMITPFVKESVGENQPFGRLEEKPKKQDTEDAMDWEQEADMDAALEFADSLLLLCSDGLYNTLDNEKIISVLKKDVKVTDMVNGLIDLANENGGYDNIAVAIIDNRGGK